MVVVDDKGEDLRAVLKEAETYLAEHGVEGARFSRQGEAAEAILTVAEQEGADLIVMGGYGATPMVEVVLGSVVDEVLRRSAVPVLLCR